MPSHGDIANLIFKHLNGELPDDERHALDQWRAASPDHESTFQKLTNPDYIKDMLRDNYSAKEKAWEKLLELAPELRPAPVRPIRRQRAIAAAAVVAVLVTSAVIVLQKIPSNKQMPVATQSSPLQDIAAGTNRATLTLADGSVVVLGDSASATKNNLDNNDTKNSNNIRSLDAAHLAYNENGSHLSDSRDAANAASGASGFNILTTPRAGQYQLTLSDGSRVWLNAASSIRYPVAFTGSERNVDIAGEVYFEVAKNALKPFRVRVTTPGAQPSTIEVLGTHFNISAYGDEPVSSTTLLEGSIRFTAPQQAPVLLTPGEQIRASATTNNISKIKIENPADIIAWKNGRTFFRDADVPAILRMIARWYDVDVRYEGTMATRHITGGISRSAPLSEILKVLELNHIHVSREGKQLIVYP